MKLEEAGRRGAVLVFPALAALLSPKAFLGLGTFFHYDTWMQNLAFRAWWFEQLRAGHFATWCPGLFAGFPLFAETQTGALYPLTFPLFLLLPAPLAFSWSVLLHFAFAGVGAWLLARRLGAGGVGAVAAGATYQLSGFLVTHVVHFNLLIGAAWAPWTLLFAWKAWGGSARSAVLLAVAVACLLLGAHPYAFLMTMLLLMIALPFRAGASRAAIAKGGTVLVVAALFGVALAAVQVLPTREFLARTPRGEAVDYAFLTFGSFPPWNVATLAAADLFGTPVDGSWWAGPDWSHFVETCAYAGIPTLALVVAALWLRRDVATLLLATSSSLAALLMLGKYTPVYRLLTWLPLWQSTRLPGRFALLLTLGVALLAGLGLDALLREKDARRRRQAIAAGIVVLVALAAVAVGLAADARSPEDALALGSSWPAKLEIVAHNTERTLGRLAIVLGAGILSLLPFAWGRPPPPALALAPLAVVVLDLLTWGASFNPTLPRARVEEAPPVVAALPATEPRPRVFRQGVDELWERAPGQPRVDAFTPSWRGREATYASGAWALPPNSQLLYGVDSGEGFTSLLPSQWLEWMGLDGRPGATPRPDLTEGQADLLSLDAVLSSGSAIAGDGWDGQSLPGDLWVSRNVDPLPRVRLALSWETVETRDEILRRVRDPDRNPRSRVLLEQGPAGSRTVRDAGPVDGVVDARETGPGAWEIDVPVESDGLVVVAESYDPDWRATDASGADLPVLRADGMFVAFFAPAAGGRVVLRHAPSSVQVGAIVSVAALVVLLAVGGVASRLRLPTLDRTRKSAARPARNFVPVIVVAVVILLSAFADVGGWRRDREASTLTAAAVRAWTEEAFAAYRAGALDSAARLLQEAQIRSSRSANISYRLGVVERARGRYNEARVAFERALEIDPSFVAAQDALKAMGESPPRE